MSDLKQEGGTFSTINDQVVYSETVPSNEDEDVKDSFNLVYFIMLLQGAGTLFPWNAFISAPDYFNTLYGESTLLYLATAYSISNLLGLLLMVLFGSKLSLMLKVVPPYIVSFLVLVTIPVLGFCHVNGVAGFSITLTLVFLTAVCTALLQGGIFGFAGMLPPIYIQALMSGNGIAGVATSIIRVITKLTIESKKPVTLQQLNLSAAIYFFVSAAVILLGIISYFVMGRTPFAQSFMKKQQKQKQLDSSERSLLGNNETQEQQKPSVFAVMKKIWHMCFLITFVFSVSLAIFPGISVTIQTSYGPTSVMADWLPVLMIVIFNVFDFIGRTLPRFVVLFGEKSVVIPVMFRVVLLPLFILCIYPRVITHDVFPFIFMGILSLSNGYLSSIIMMTAPGLVAPHEKELTGTLMTFFLLLGICIGSNSAMLIGKVVGLS